MPRAIVRFVLLCVAILSPIAVYATTTDENRPISDFFGTFEGRTLFPMGEPGNRGLKVTVREHNTNGFTVLWETTIQKGQSGAQRKATSVSFEPSTRPHIFEAVYPPGGAPNIMAGDSFSWARIKGATLTVHVITIVDGGDYVMQSYHRTLTSGGMHLEFVRLRDGVVERQLKGNLTRVKPLTREVGNE